MRYILTICLSLLFLISADAQGFAYGFKGGLTIGTQRWDNSLSRDPLFSYHGITFIESAAEDNSTAIFGQLGYHVKGSAIRRFATTVQTSQGLIDIPSRKDAFRFNNVSLTLGGKKKHDLGNYYAYYLLGIRGDFTVSTNLEEYEILNQTFPIYPFEAGVREVNYGVTVGGGIEFPIGEYISGLLEFTVNPDFSRQYEQPQLDNVTNPTNGQSFTVRERRITNNTFELSLGIRFLRLVEYID